MKPLKWSKLHEFQFIKELGRMKAHILVFKTAFGFAVRCLDSMQFQLIDLSHSTAGSL